MALYIILAHAVLDFTGDGRDDIVLQNAITGDVTIWETDGTTRRSTIDLGTQDAAWHVIAPHHELV